MAPTGCKERLVMKGFRRRGARQPTTSILHLATTVYAFEAQPRLSSPVVAMAGQNDRVFDPCGLKNRSSNPNNRSSNRNGLNDRVFDPYGLNDRSSNSNGLNNRSSNSNDLTDPSFEPNGPSSDTDGYSSDP
ncbi:hypothetical protein LX32DRAFT_649996 [Colletotrichum zoysiae]|uniref:Uncharacterized protein n=1 Tax=Colletotrichum zoysiae TaxID=1216348 RepID=A0AAD9HNH1_9PEZI|nr:hypothetical protein LX32DRAFT_649996 [Colletotrichum zoysiae]